jgi:UTP--glucose-1-phosphate uridylyltransferase
VPRKDTALYGVVGLKGKLDKKDFVKITKFVEKPRPSTAPSTWAMPGRYVFDRQTTNFLRNLKPGKNGEYQLTDGMQTMLDAGHSFFAKKISGRRFDTGDKFGYLTANIEFGLQDPALKTKLRKWLDTRFKK